MKECAPIPAATNAVSSQIVSAAYNVHCALGPGLLESVYEVCLAHELTKVGLDYKRQQGLPVVYDGVRLEAGLRLDLLVAGRVIVEIKAVESLHPVFEAQVLTYLKLTGIRVGLLINFNVPVLKAGIKRIVL